jgi:predicted DCC family thiol-disulfide oxidoreductase YuxK
MHPTTAEGSAGIFLYDGDCTFCTSAAGWMVRRIRPRDAVVPWQGQDLVALAVPVTEVQMAVVRVHASRRARGPAAIAGLMRTSPSWSWRAAGQVLGSPPVRVIADPVYRTIARNRHRLPGGTPQCAIDRSAA